MSSVVIDGGASSSTIAKPKLDVVWLTAIGKAKEASNQKLSKRHKSAAMKKATKMYHAELQKGKEGKSAEQVSAIIKKQFDGVGRSARSITRYVNEYSLIDTNTTAVSQETDRNYGPFKSQFQKNLTTITDKRLEQKKSVSLQP